MVTKLKRNEPECSDYLETLSRLVLGQNMLNPASDWWRQEMSKSWVGLIWSYCGSRESYGYKEQGQVKNENMYLLLVARDPHIPIMASLADWTGARIVGSTSYGPSTTSKSQTFHRLTAESEEISPELWSSFYTKKFSNRENRAARLAVLMQLTLPHNWHGLSMSLSSTNRFITPPSWDLWVLELAGTLREEKLQQKSRLGGHKL